LKYLLIEHKTTSSTAKFHMTPRRLHQRGLLKEARTATQFGALGHFPGWEKWTWAGTRKENGSQNAHAAPGRNREDGWIVKIFSVFTYISSSSAGQHDLMGRSWKKVVIGP
jgi:hypothetical protein